MTSLTTRDAGELLTVAEAAMLCGCSAPTIRRRIHEGELPAVQLGGPGKALRVRRDELEAWLTAERPSYLDRQGQR
jgi:excisionase family DNA binding protein